MKKYILIIAMFTLSVIANAQQTIPNEFFGLKFGNQYTFEQIKFHVGENGTFFETNDTLELGSIKCLGYTFQNVTYEDRRYPLMTLLTLNSGTLGGVLFTFGKSDIPANQTLETLYDNLCEELSQKYELTDNAILDDLVTKVSVDEDGNAVTISYQKTEGEEMVGITYMPMSLLFPTALKADLPTLQDTFFGMKIGSQQTTTSIKSAVGYKGTFVSEKNALYGKMVIFKDFMFAGQTWDFGTFIMNDEGVLYEIRAEISLEDYSLDDKNEANRIYQLFKERLSKKYGEKDEESDEEGTYINYVGNNMILLTLSNERSKSNSGEYRRYVILDYIDLSTMEQLSKQSNDEL